MPINDAAPITAAKGYIFTGAVGATPPTPATVDTFVASTTVTGFTNIGHTSRDDLPEFGFDGGDTETRGSWQNDALRQVVTDTTVDYVTFNLLQFDEEALSLYYGVTNSSVTEGVFGVSGSGAPTERSLLIIIVDGATNIAFYANKASITREEAITLAVDDFATLPLRATFLKNGSNDLFQWISLDTGINEA